MDDKLLLDDISFRVPRRGIVRVDLVGWKLRNDGVIDVVLDS
jgi:hypothetical protein